MILHANVDKKFLNKIIIDITEPVMISGFYRSANMIKSRFQQELRKHLRKT